MRGPALAPAQIREVLYAGATNLCSENGMRKFSLDKVIDISDPVYLSIDMDVLDPAFAPGVSHHEPGGLSTRNVIEIIQRLKAPIIGADIVEYNPKRDPTEITAMAAVKLFKEIVARMIEQIADGRFSAGGGSGARA